MMMYLSDDVKMTFKYPHLIIISGRWSIALAVTSWKGLYEGWHILMSSSGPGPMRIHSTSALHHPGMKFPPWKKGCPKTDFNSKLPFLIDLDSEISFSNINFTTFSFSFEISLVSLGSISTSNNMRGWSFPKSSKFSFGLSSGTLLSSSRSQSLSSRSTMFRSEISLIWICSQSILFFNFLWFLLENSSPYHPPLVWSPQSNLYLPYL